jgi:hypothetical protein
MQLSVVARDRPNCINILYFSFPLCPKYEARGVLLARGAFFQPLQICLWRQLGNMFKIRFSQFFSIYWGLDKDPGCTFPSLLHLLPLHYLLSSSLTLSPLLHTHSYQHTRKQARVSNRASKQVCIFVCTHRTRGN